MANFMVVGDIHGDWETFRQYLDAVPTNYDAILQVGDFGYWPRMSNWHEDLDEYLAGIGKRLYFCDGNHEDHEMLPSIDLEFVTHVPRGEIIEIAGVKVGFFGGAVSVDRQWRHPGVTWFHNEAPGFIDLVRLEERVKTHGVPDIMVTHDCPSFVGPQYKTAGIFPQEDSDAANRHRESVMNYAYELAPAREWYYGHHHRHAVDIWEGTTFIGLSESRDSWDKFVRFIHVPD